LLLLIGLFNLVGMAETTLLPVIATRVLHGGAGTLALLAGAAGAGAFAAAVCLAWRCNVRGLDGWVSAAAAVYGLAMLVFTWTGSPLASALLLSATGFTLLLLTAGANTLLQTIAADDMRGRVVSLYTLAVTGLAPLGGLGAGLLADRVGVAATLRLAGLACVVGSAAFAVRLARRPDLFRVPVALTRTLRRGENKEVLLPPPCRPAAVGERLPAASRCGTPSAA
jgi:MFS family permease